MIVALRDFTRGARMFADGFALMARNKRLWLLGAVPALVATVLVVTLLVLLGVWAGGIVDWATPFADGWQPRVRYSLRLAATVVLMAAAVAVAVVTFSALTLLIGGPFYEYIAEKVEDQLGGKPPDYHASWLRMSVRGVRDSVLLVGLSVMCVLPLLCLGLVPVLGQTVVPAAAACVGGWILALELVGVPFHRRGLRLGDRHRALRTRPALTLGFAVPAYLVCAVPLLAVVVMPAAAAGGTLLARAVLADRPAERAEHGR